VRLRAGCAAGRVWWRSCNGCKLLLTLCDHGGTGGAESGAGVLVDAVRLTLALYGCTDNVVRLTLARCCMIDAGAGVVRLAVALYGVRLALAQMLYDWR
jgi:hypothetical protein